MIPLPYKLIAAGITIIFLLGLGFGTGYHFANKKYIAYKSEIETVVKKQQLENDAIKKERDLISKNAKDNYEAQLSAIRAYYGRLHVSSTKSMPSFSFTAPVVDENSPNYQLVEACSETTLQLTALQEWVMDQWKIK